MVWEIILAVILAIGILTSISEIRSKRAGKKPKNHIEKSQDTKYLNK